MPGPKAGDTGEKIKTSGNVSAGATRTATPRLTEEEYKRSEKATHEWEEKHGLTKGTHTTPTTTSSSVTTYSISGNNLENRRTDLRKPESGVTGPTSGVHGSSFSTSGSHAHVPATYGSGSHGCYYPTSYRSDFTSPEKKKREDYKMKRSPTWTDPQKEERARRGNLVDKWEEKFLTDSTEGIPVENVKDYISDVGDTLMLKDKEMIKMVSQKIKNLTDHCTEHGLFDRVKGTIEGNTSMYGIVFAFKDSDGTITIKYAVHKLVLIMQKRYLEAEVNHSGTTETLYKTEEVQSKIGEKTEYQREQACEQMKRLGVTISDELKANFAADDERDLKGKSSFCALM